MDHVRSAMRMFSKADTIGASDFVLAIRKFVAERAGIKCLFNFEVDVDLEEMRIFPSPDVATFLDVLHRTNMSVLYVAANFRPIKSHFMIAPYVAMAEGEADDDDDDDGNDGERALLSNPSAPKSKRRSSFVDDATSSAYLWSPQSENTDYKRLEIPWVKVRGSQERSDELKTPSQAAKTARARTSVQDAPPL